MKQLLLITCTLFVCQLASAQFLFKPHYTIIDPNDFSNQVTVAALNPLPGMHFFHQNTEYAVGDTINDYASWDTLMCTYLEDTFYTMVGPHQDFHLTSYLPATHIYSFDGTVEFAFDEPVGFYNGQIDITYSIDQYGYSPVSSDSVHFVIPGTGASTFKCFGNAMNGEIFTVPFRLEGIFFDQYGQYASYGGIALNLLLDVDLTLSDVSGNCNGSANTTVNNAIGNVNYMWSANAPTTADHVDNLCPGLYYLYAEDEGDQSDYELFVITEVSDNYYDPNNTNASTDTINLGFMTCDLDYNATIDSVQLNLAVSSQTNDTVYYDLTLLVFQGNDTTAINTTIMLHLEPNVLFSIALYCQSTFKSTDFQGRKIIIEQTGLLAGLPTNQLEERILYPNPATEKLTITGTNGRGSVTDVNGRTVLLYESGEMKVNLLENGVYFVHPEGESAAYRFVKQ